MEYTNIGNTSEENPSGRSPPYDQAKSSPATLCGNMSDNHHSP